MTPKADPCQASLGFVLTGSGPIFVAFNLNTVRMDVRKEPTWPDWN